MYRIGVDLGGTKIAVGLVDDSFRIVTKATLPTGAEREGEAIVDDIAKLCRKVCADAGVSAGLIGSVGIASPGIANNAAGRVEYANNLPFRRFPVARLLRERFDAGEVYVENDANAAAWGEAVAGAAKGSRDSVMITLGTGVGGGIIIDNKIYTGSNCAGAELGHIVIVYGGYPCTCGRRGCWESYSSATALIRMTREAIAGCKAAGRKTLMSGLAEKSGGVDGRTAFDAARQGDEPAREVCDMYIAYLACGLTNIVNIFQPEVISLGGGISNEGQPLVDALLPLITAEQYGGDSVTHTEIRIAKLGNDAGIIGAAALGA